MWRAAIIFGSYITTFGGASLSLISPGAYQLLSVESVTAKVLFLPCPGDPRCHFISRFSVKVEEVLLLVSVSQGNWVEFTVAIHKQDNTETITFPTTKVFGRIDLTWRVENYLRVSVNGKLSFLVSSSASGLSIGAKVHQDWFGKTRGLLGQSDGNYLNDLHSSAMSDMDLTAENINKHLHQNFMIDSLIEAKDLMDTVAGHNLTTCGHMLRLTNHSVLFARVPVMVVTEQLTITFWLRSESAVISAEIFELRTLVGLITVKVHLAEIIITWLETSTVVLRPPRDGMWTYLALSWDGHTGILNAFAIQENGIDYSTTATITLVRADVLITEISLAGPQSSSAVEIDLVRVWQVAKSLESIAVDMKYYKLDQAMDPQLSVPALLLSVGFDEGEGLAPSLSVHASGNTTAVSPSTVKGKITDGLQPSLQAQVWAPSTIPVFDIILPQDLVYSPDTNASAKLCLKSLTEVKLVQYCSDLEAFSSQYLEACIREHQRTQWNVNVTVNVANLFAFFCQTTNSVEECELDSYVDFCAPVDNVFPVWIIIVICVVVLVVICITCCCVVFWVKKKQKRKQSRPLCETSFPTMSLDEEETAFSRRGSGDVAGFENPSFGQITGYPVHPRNKPYMGPREGSNGSEGQTLEAACGKPTGSNHSEAGSEDEERYSRIASTPSHDFRSKKDPERPNSGPQTKGKPDFKDQPHVEAWPASPGAQQKKGKTKKAKQSAVGVYPAQSPEVPLGFSPSHDRQQRHEDPHLSGSTTRPLVPRNIYHPMDAAAPLEDTKLCLDSFRAEEPSYQDEVHLQTPRASVHGASGADRQKIVLDELEIEPTAPIIFMHDDNGSRPSSSRQNARRASTKTPEHINLAFQGEDE